MIYHKNYVVVNIRIASGGKIVMNTLVMNTRNIDFNVQLYVFGIN